MTEEKRKRFLTALEEVIDKFENDETVTVDVKFEGNTGRFAWDGEKLVEVKEEHALEA